VRGAFPLDAAFSSLDFPGLDWGGYSREEVLDLLTEAALDSLDGTGADFAAQAPARFTPLDSRESDSPDTADPSAFFALAERDGAAAALAAWEEARFYSEDEEAKAHRQAVETALAAGKDVPAEVLKDYPDLKPAAPAWEGGMTHAARSQTRTASAQAVRDFIARGGPASGEEVAALGNHLARLTVAQLHALRAEHGLPAAGAWRMRRPDLVNALAGRFRDHRAATPTHAARELAAAVKDNPSFKEAGYKPSDAVHAVQHQGTGFRATAHPDGRFHVFGSGLTHEGVHDTAAAAVAHAANPPAKPSPDYRPRTADVETAARQGAVADAAARREGRTVSGADLQSREREGRVADLAAADTPQKLYGLEPKAGTHTEILRQLYIAAKEDERTGGKADAGELLARTTGVPYLAVRGRRDEAHTQMIAGARAAGLSEAAIRNVFAAHSEPQATGLDVRPHGKTPGGQDLYGAFRPGDRKPLAVGGSPEEARQLAARVDAPEQAPERPAAPTAPPRATLDRPLHEYTPAEYRQKVADEAARASAAGHSFAVGSYTGGGRYGAGAVRSVNGKLELYGGRRGGKDQWLSVTNTAYDDVARQLGLPTTAEHYHARGARFTADDSPAVRPVRFVPLVQPAEAARA
jgi:hypothetical protein